MSSTVRTFKTAGIEIDDGCLIISTKNIHNYNKHYNVIIFHDITNNFIRVTADRPKIQYYESIYGIPSHLVSEKCIEDYTPWFSKTKKKRVKNGYVEFKEVEKMEFTTNIFIIEENK